jgi:uncharacterized protein YndB with AHSA1/START domain
MPGPIRKTIEVRVPVERAWSTFTNGMGKWWPLDSHSIAQRRAVDVIVEPREGGVVYEVKDDGTTAVWADITVWDPPDRLVLAWRVNPEQPVTEVEVTFTGTEGTTSLVLEHRGWEDEESRASYDGGWDFVLGRYLTALGI